jgi:hypothetical protein
MSALCSLPPTVRCLELSRNGWGRLGSWDWLQEDDFLNCGSLCRICDVGCIMDFTFCQCSQLPSLWGTLEFFTKQSTCAMTWRRIADKYLLIISSSHLGVVSNVTVDTHCSGTFSIEVSLGRGQTDFSLCNQCVPFCHNWWFWSWWGALPLAMRSAGFSCY